MTLAYSHLAGKEVDTSSEDWRRECECRYLITKFPTREKKHYFLYGVHDRDFLFRRNTLTGEVMLKEEYTKLWPKNEKGRTIKPLMGHRSLEEADRILADAKRLFELTQPK